MIEWDESLTLVESALLQVPTHLVVATAVVVLRDQAAVELRRHVPLLARRRSVGFQDGIDNGAKWSEHGSGSRLRACVRLRLRIGERLENGLG